MNIKQSIIETIKKRKSIRTYEAKPISEEDYLVLKNYINDEKNLVGPFQRKARFDILRVLNNRTDKGVKLGTYGFIKNHQGFLVGKMENSKMALVEFGYIFEKLILFCTQLDIGTCWIGGTFNRNTFAEEIELKEGEFIPCISPIGYPKEKQRMFDKTLRYVTKADNKKSWEELFFKGDFETTLTETEAGPFATAIEMVRLGPSASNKQPWRLVLSENKKQCHFFLQHTPNYSGNKLGFEMQRIDLGIAMCHFELAINEQKIQGEWIISDPKLEIFSENIEYVVSWHAK